MSNIIEKDGYKYIPIDNHIALDEVLSGRSIWVYIGPHFTEYTNAGCVGAQYYRREKIEAEIGIYHDLIRDMNTAISNIMLDFALAMSTCDDAVSDECYEKSIEVMKSAKSRADAILKDK